MMELIQLVPRAYREQAGVQECFKDDYKVKTCATNDQNCAKFGTSEDKERDCYAKNEWWSGCVANCTAGMTDSFGDDTPWNCRKAEKPVTL